LSDKPLDRINDGRQNQRRRNEIRKKASRLFNIEGGKAMLVREINAGES